MTKEEILDGLFYYKTHFTRTDADRELFDEAMKIIEQENNEPIVPMFNTPYIFKVDTVNIPDAMDYEKLWNDLKQKLEQDIEYYKEGCLCSLGESIHGERTCKELLGWMLKHETDISLL